MHGPPFHCVEYAKDDAALLHEPPQNYAQELSYPVHFHLVESDDETTVGTRYVHKNEDTWLGKEKSIKDRGHLRTIPTKPCLGYTTMMSSLGTFSQIIVFCFFLGLHANVGGVSLSAYFEGLKWFEPSAVSHLSFFCVVPHLASCSRPSDVVA